jgi:thioredoxin 1
MKKIIKLTESDLMRLVKRVIKEQKNDNGYMELVLGQTYEFFPVFPEEDKLRINTDTLKSDLFKMKILSYANKVLEGMVGETKMVYNENFFTPKSTVPQRYFCEKNNPKKCITDTNMGYTKLGKKDLSKKVGDFMNPDKSQSLFSEVTDNNFDSLVLKSTVPFIVDFSAVWCGPCRMVAKTLTEIKREYGDKFEMGKLDIDFEIKTREKYKIRSVPVIMIFKNGKMVKKIEGIKPIEEYKREINSIL